MIFGSGQQNKTLKDAGSKPKDTSYRTANANKLSAKISKKDTTSSINIASSRDRLESDTRPKSRPSWQGYMGEKSAVLQLNDVGYASKSLQTARYNKDFINHNTGINLSNPFTNTKKRDIIDNYGFFSSKESSSFKLNSIIENNRLF